MDNESVRNIIKDVVSLLIEETLLECNEDATKEDYMNAIDRITDKALKKLGTKFDKKFQNDAEDLLKEKMLQGFDIGIECKGKSREYEMTFEGTASHISTPLEDRLFESALYHGVGDTIEELLDSMFNKKGMNKYKKKRPKK